MRSAYEAQLALVEHRKPKPYSLGMTDKDRKALGLPPRNTKPN